MTRGSAAFQNPKRKKSKSLLNYARAIATQVVLRKFVFLITMLYSKEIIERTTQWVEDDVHAKHWLQQHQLEELVQLKDAVSRHAKAFEYLLVNKHLVLAAFVNAVWEDKKAFQLLMDQKAVVWAAMANYINGDDRAAAFLKNNKLEHYAQLAHVIQAKIRREGDEGLNFFKSGPYKG